MAKVSCVCGKGKVAGVTISIILLQLISSAFNVMRIDTVITDMVYGIILIIALVVPIITAKISAKK